MECHRSQDRSMGFIDTQHLRSGGKQGLGRDTQWVTSKQAEAPGSVSNLRVEGHRWLESSRPTGISEDLFLEAHVMHGGLW